MAKKVKKSKVAVNERTNNNEERSNNNEDDEQLAVRTVVHNADSDVQQTIATSTESNKKKNNGAVRGVCAMHKVVMKKAQGKKLKVSCNRLGVPVGDTRHTLQSYVGMLARTMVPIDILSWPKVDSDLKEKIWSDIQVQ